MPTPFQEEVYKALEKIPKGSITTYGAIAKYLNTKAIRAVGTAVGKNPNAPQIPCHRVVPSSGKIGNYSGEGGIETKVRLLEEEGVEVKEGKIVNYQQHLFVFKSQDDDL
ncbi:MAG: MGMT family protein [Sulfurimonadaceae bacterium]